MSLFVLLFPIPAFIAVGCAVRWLETQSSRAAKGFKCGIYGMVACAFLALIF